MKIKFILPLLILCLVSMAFATNVEVGSHSPTGKFSPSNNYEYPSISTTWIDTESISGNSGNAIPVVCDSDQDGEDEVHVYTGRTISIYGMDESNLFELENTLEIGSASIGNINALGCVDLAGDSVNKDIIFSHHGSTNGSSIVLFTEYDPVWDDIESPVGSFGSPISGRETNYFNGGYINGTIDADSQFYCSERISGWTDSGEYDCVIGNDDGLLLLNWSAWVNSGNGDRFPIVDNTVSDANIWQNATLNLAYTTDIGSDIERAVGFVHLSTPNRYMYARSGNDMVKFTINSDSSNWVQAVDPGSWRSTTIFYFLMRADYSDDGSDDLCIGGGSGLYSDGWVSCINPSDDSEVYYSQRPPSGGNEYWLTSGAFDTDGDGNINWCPIYEDNGVKTLSCFGSTGGDISQGFTPPTASMGISIARVKGEDNYTAIAIGTNVFFYNNTNDSISGTTTISGSFSTFVDLNNDFEVELLSYNQATGGTTLYSLDALTSGGTITLQNPNQTGSGYFGWYDGTNCNGTVTIEATECLGSDTDCTYTSTSSTSKERLCSTCGETQSLTCGSYSFAHPIINCNLSVEDTYNITVYIESDALSGFYQGANNPDIQITTEDGLEGSTCNAIDSYYSAPSTFDDYDSATTTPNGTVVPDTETFNPEKPGYFGNSYNFGFMQLCKVETDNIIYNVLHTVTLCNSILQMLASLLIAGVIASLFLWLSPSETSHTVAIVSAVVVLIFFATIYYISWYFPIILAVIFLGIEVLKSVLSSGSGAR